MKVFPLLIIFTFIFSCSPPHEKQKRSFQVFDFSFDSGWGTTFSLKFTRGDSIYLGNGRFSKKYYWGKLNHEQLKTLDSLVLEFLSQKWDTAYIQDGIVDNSSYNLYLKQGSAIKKVFVYGNVAPEPLKHFCWWLALLKERLNFQPIDTTIAFASLHRFYPPIPHPDSTKFLPPDPKKHR